MAKPGKKSRTPSEEMAHFTDREDQQEEFRRYLYSANEPPVLVLYGIGGAGKTWLIRNLLGQVPSDVPKAIIDLNRTAGGRRFVTDPAAALYEIREQLGSPTPRFDLAYGVLRYKQGAVREAGALTDLVAELLGAVIPGATTILKRLSKPLQQKLKETGLEEFLAVTENQKFLLSLRTKTTQEIGAGLLQYLSDDLRASIPPHLNRAVSIVLFFDTFEAVSSEAQNEEHKRQNEQWIRDVASNLDFALTVIAGQNRLTWDEIDPEWTNHLDQHLVGGLSQADARRFFTDCGIDDSPTQDAILSTAREEDGGYHCFSLGLFADIVASEVSQNKKTNPASLQFAPQDWERLAHRFLKSLGSDAEARWIERLALTPRFDERAARAAFSAEHSAAQDAAWEALPGYSFVEKVQGEAAWLTVRAQMRWALKNQPSARDRVSQDHAWWQEHWNLRSSARFDRAASLAWYHLYCVAPKDAIMAWERLAESARNSVPPRMSEHFAFLEWWEPVDLLDLFRPSTQEASAFEVIGIELQRASLGSRTLNLRRAIACFEAALRVYLERDFPENWAATQNNLGTAWSDMPTGDRGENLRRAIACFEAALRVYNERDFPQDWAGTQNNLGTAWSNMPTGDRDENLHRAIACYEAALRVLTERDWTRDWALTQNNLGTAWRNMPTGDLGENLRRAIACYEAALRVYTERDSPENWAMTQNNLGLAWSDMPTGERGENLRRAIACYEAALRVRTERDFPREWAMTQNNLGVAWYDIPKGDRGKNLSRAIACYDDALRVWTERDFPQHWAGMQNNLGSAWRDMPTGDWGENLRRAIACYEAALRVYTERDAPENWAMTQDNLGTAWADMPTGDWDENQRRAIAYYEAALRVRTERDFPRAWAGTENNLGTAWLGTLTGDRGENLRRAIACFEAALRVYIERDFPQSWAMTQNNLGLTWSEMPAGDRGENLCRAIAYYEAALRVLTERDFPQDWARTQNNLGTAWSDMPAGDRGENLRRAIAYYEAALRIYTEEGFPQEHATAERNFRQARAELENC